MAEILTSSEDECKSDLDGAQDLLTHGTCCLGEEVTFGQSSPPSTFVNAETITYPAPPDSLLHRLALKPGDGQEKTNLWTKSQWASIILQEHVMTS